MNEIKFSPKFILAWDLDFTNVTDEGMKLISEAEKSGFMDDENIYSNSIGIEE